MNNRTKMARILATILATMMLLGTALVMAKLIFAEEDTTQTREKEKTELEKKKLEEEYQREEEYRMINSYIHEIESLIEKYKNQDGYYKAVKKLQDFLRDFDFNQNDAIFALREMIDGFKKDKSDVKKPIFIGDDSNLFRPDDYITRAEFSTILMRLMDIPLDSSKVWYENAMNKAKELGLMKGDESGDLMPMKNLTLAEVMAIFQRQKEILPLDGTSLGIDKNHWARGVMERAKLDGWMDRIEKINEPDRFITRGELAAILTEVRNIKIDRKEILDNLGAYPKYVDLMQNHKYFFDILVNSK